MIKKYWKATMVIVGLAVTVSSNFLPSDLWQVAVGDVGLILITSVWWGPWLLPRLLDLTIKLVMDYPSETAAVWTGSLAFSMFVLKQPWIFLGLFALGIILVVVGIGASFIRHERRRR